MKTTTICRTVDCHWWTYVTASATRCGGCRRPEGSRCKCKPDDQPPDMRSGHKYNLAPDVRADLQAKRFKPPVLATGDGSNLNGN